MKQKIYITGYITVLLVFTGLSFKLNHYPGAGILITAGIFTLLAIFLPMALVNNYRAYGNKQNLLLYLVTWLTCLLMFTAMLFKIQHWPGAGTLLLISLPFPFVVFLPVYLTVTSKIKNFNNYNTVFILFLMASISVFSALMALSVSRNRINDSLALAEQYNWVEKPLVKILAAAVDVRYSEAHSALIAEIDETAALVDECRKMLLRKARITEDQWNSDPQIAVNLDSRLAAKDVMLQGEDPLYAFQLEARLKSLIRAMEITPGFEDMSRLAPYLFELGDPGPGDLPWPYMMFSNNYLSWVLIYFDALQTNLLSIKAGLS